MTQRLIRAIALAVAAAAASPAAAQQAAATPVRVGFGVGLEPFSLFAFGGPRVAPLGAGLYLPIRIGSSVRVEPSLSIFRFTQDAAVGDPKLSAVSLGAGVFYAFQTSGPVSLYVGPRLALVFASREDVAGPSPTTTETTETDFQFTAALGGEYHVVPGFSVGAEAQLAFTWFGDQRTSGTPTVSRDALGISTNAVVFLRYYFN